MMYSLLVDATLSIVAMVIHMDAASLLKPSSQLHVVSINVLVLCNVRHLSGFIGGYFM